jgi:hypothetical protein
MDTKRIALSVKQALIQRGLKALIAKSEMLSVMQLMLGIKGQHNTNTM